MAIYNATKLMFECALRDLLKDNTFKKVSVQKIVDYAESTRSTFYHHFKDKYDLVAWIYEKQADRIINRFPEITWLDVIINLFKGMEQDLPFYLKVLADRDQNALVNYMVDYDISVYTNMLYTFGGLSTLDEQLEFDINFHAFACVHMTQLWVLNKKRESPETLSYKLINAMPRHLYESLPNRGI